MVFALAMLIGLSACSVPAPGGAPGGIHDPYEEANRRNHQFNLAIDRGVVRPAGKGYTRVVPEPVSDTVSNFANNLNLPGMVANNLLQGNFGGALQNSLRFVVNTLFGIGGLGDPASEVGIDVVDTDFGETLYVWGVPEGAYVELPLFGPSTERGAVGKVVDLFTNPLSYTLHKPEKYYGTGANVASKVGDRGRYSDTIDSILYESADSYAQSRIIYLQNRRFKLGSDGGSSYVDPYDDPYGEPNADSYDDPYAE